MAPDDLEFLETTWECLVSGMINNPSNLSFQMAQPLKRTVVGRSRGLSCVVCLAVKGFVCRPKSSPSSLQSPGRICIASDFSVAALKRTSSWRGSRLLN